MQDSIEERKIFQSPNDTSTRDASESGRSSEYSSTVKENNVDFCVNVEIGTWDK